MLITETISMHRTNSHPAWQAHPCTLRKPCSAPAFTTYEQETWVSKAVSKAWGFFPALQSGAKIQ